MRAYLDTAPVIYLVENVPLLETAARRFLYESAALPQASVLTRMECRVQPLREGRKEVLAEFDAFFASLDGGLLQMGSGVFEKAAELRASLGFRTPDALHLAAAISHGCDVFVTNDRRLARCGEIKIEVLQP